MNLTPSWDLAIIVFFGIVMAYSFIIGKHQSVKIIIGTYIAIIASQGIGNVLGRMIGDSTTAIHILGIGFDVTVLAIVKVVLLLTFAITFAIRSGIDVSYSKQTNTFLNIFYTGIFGLCTAGLILSALFTFATGGGILDHHTLQWNQLGPIASGSQLLLLLVLNPEIWFTLPALLILATGFLHND